MSIGGSSLRVMEVEIDEKSIGEKKMLESFYRRASEAEERLARLEATIALKQDESNNGSDKSSQEISSMVDHFKSNLDIAQNDLTTEREKAATEIKKLVAENAKLRYRISHILRALREIDHSSPLLNQDA
ncbi:hypothetical protein ZOSMA_52G00430 [Zostera marina]|uniref:Uncharacterized protein n=1 Tax=Zostera marina TaxID=29655 RepID=A0A0K9NZG3_ZOSMR|nr:hypothetical protein ZOSMA_52G00430 [Zostera marina]